MASCYNCGKEYTPNIDKFCANCIGFAMFILHGGNLRLANPPWHWVYRKHDFPIRIT